MKTIALKNKKSIDIKCYDLAKEKANEINEN